MEATSEDALAQLVSSGRVGLGLVRILRGPAHHLARHPSELGDRLAHTADTITGKPGQDESWCNSTRSTSFTYAAVVHWCPASRRPAGLRSGRTLLMCPPTGSDRSIASAATRTCRSAGRPRPGVAATTTRPGVGLTRPRTWPTPSRRPTVGPSSARTATADWTTRTGWRSSGATRSTWLGPPAGARPGPYMKPNTGHSRGGRPLGWGSTWPTRAPLSHAFPLTF